jgi:hypothetical protein
MSNVPPRDFFPPRFCPLLWRDAVVESVLWGDWVVGTGGMRHRGREWVPTPPPWVADARGYCGLIAVGTHHLSGGRHWQCHPCGLGMSPGCCTLHPAMRLPPWCNTLRTRPRVEERVQRSSVALPAGKGRGYNPADQRGDPFVLASLGLGPGLPAIRPAASHRSGVIRSLAELERRL